MRLPHFPVRVTRDLSGLKGVELPSWDSLLRGARPPFRDPDEFEPNSQRFGWQHEAAASRVESHHRDRVLFPWLGDHEKALVPRAELGQAEHFLQCHPATPPDSSHNCSASFSYVDCTSLYPCLFATADVAVHLTLVATIGQLARRQGGVVIL